MATSERTKHCRNCYIGFSIVSLLLWVGAALFAVISGISIASGNHTGILTPEFKAKLISLSATVIILLMLTLFMGQKLRMLVWMMSLILGTVAYGDVAMFSLFGVWILDEYVFSTLSKHYKSKLSINKEIDMRG